MLPPGNPFAEAASAAAASTPSRKSVSSETIQAMVRSTSLFQAITTSTVPSGPKAMAWTTMPDVASSRLSVLMEE